MRATAARSAGLPRVARWALIGAGALGAAGALAGVVIGLFAYPPTALFAAVELGVPAALAGTVLGVVAAGVTAAGRRVSSPRTPPG